MEQLNIKQKILYGYVIMVLSVVGIIYGTQILPYELEKMEDKRLTELSKTQEVQFLEFEARVYAHMTLDGEYTSNRMFATFASHDEDYHHAVDYTDDLNYFDNNGMIMKHKNESQLVFSFWQLDPNFITDDERGFIIGDTLDQYPKKYDNWQDNQKFTQVYGLQPMSQMCLNGASVCFDEIDDMIILIHELNDNLIIEPERIQLINERISHAERLDEDTILAIFNSDGIMPQYHYYLNTMPLWTMAIHFEMENQDPCFWDTDERMCNLELKLGQHEVKGHE